MRRPPLVTLTTDIGWAYAAQVKASLLRVAPTLSIVDVTHDVRPQGAREAAFLLGHLVPQFPPGTIHIAVVDPGVGGARAAIAIRCRDGSMLVGPDNGVLALAANVLGGGSGIRLEPSRLAPGGVASATFEGRDVFAPAAAALATGRPLRALGRRASWAPLELPAPTLGRGRADGEVLYVDVFGNAITNLPGGTVPTDTDNLEVRLGRKRAHSARRVRTYSDLSKGEVGLLGSSFGLLEVAERDGSAARRWRIAPGDGVRLRWSPRAGKGGK